MKVGNKVKIKKLASYTYGGRFENFLLNWNNVNCGTIYEITKYGTDNKIYVTQNNHYYTFKEQELELINWLKII